MGLEGLLDCRDIFPGGGEGGDFSWDFGSNGDFSPWRRSFFRGGFDNSSASYPLEGAVSLTGASRHLLPAKACPSIGATTGFSEAAARECGTLVGGNGRGRGQPVANGCITCPNA